jgi:hypothetical protein
LSILILVIINGKKSMEQTNNREKTKALIAKIKTLRKELKLYKPKVSPMEHALLQKQLGDAYLALGETPPRTQGHFRNAEKAYENALYYYSLETDPALFFEMQYGYFQALEHVWHKEHEKFRRKAQPIVDAVPTTLKLLNPHSNPQSYASAYRRLGEMYREIAPLKRDALFHDIQTSHKKSPIKFATLGSETSELAIGAFQEALRYCDPQTCKEDYADIMADILDGLAEAHWCYIQKDPQPHNHNISHAKESIRLTAKSLLHDLEAYDEYEHSELVERYTALYIIDRPSALQVWEEVLGMLKPKLTDPQMGQLDDTIKAKLVNS